MAKKKVAKLTKKKASKKKSAVKKKVSKLRRASSKTSTGKAKGYSSSSSSGLVQTKVFFQRSVLRELKEFVSKVQLDEGQYSQSIFVERAVQRELERVSRAGGLKDFEKVRS